MKQLQNSTSLHQSLVRLWRHIDRPRRRGFSLLLLLTVFASLAEIVSIGAVVPFLGVLTNPERVFAHPLVQPLIAAFNLNAPKQLVAPLALGLSIAAIFACAMRLVLLKASTRLTFATGADLSTSIYRRTLYQPYVAQITRNSSEIISGISTKTTAVIYGVILPILTLISSGIMLMVIMLALLAIDPFIALFSVGGFAVLYALIIGQTRRRLTIASQSIARQSTWVIKIMQEGLGGIRDILIDGSQATYCEIYRRADLDLRRAQESNQFISQSPKFVMEALGIVLIAGLAYLLTKDPTGSAKAIPVLGALAMAAQRLLPVLQQAYSSWSSILGSQTSLQDTLDLLDQPLPDYADGPAANPIAYRHKMSFKNVSFRYGSESPWVLKDVNLDIMKGSCVGFIGKTGSGKSTLLDLVMGLLRPSEGALTIDGLAIDERNVRAWQAHIAHVPQAIFLSDATIAENIAFGVPPSLIDHAQVREAARKAQIASTIESWSEQYETRVGERGVRLSGGQRQRIGIARALYKHADVIIFDEATSALDNDTEHAVMEAIGGLSGELTVFIVAHRLSTLKNCTQVVELVDGAISRTGTYLQIVGQ